MCQCTPEIRTPWCGKGACLPPPRRTPDREEVYEAWCRVQRLRAECQKAESEHARLAELRYGATS